MDRGIRVLLVDDDPGVAEGIAEYLAGTHDRFEVVTETGASGGLDRLAVDPVDCVVSDYDMPGMDGLQFLEAVRADRPELPFVLYTGRGSEDVASRAISKGVTDYFVKGRSDANVLLAKRVENAVEHHRAERAVEETRNRFQALVRAAPDAVLVLDREGTVTYATPSAEAILGRAPADLVGTTGFDPVHPEDVGAVRETFDELVAEPMLQPSIEFRYQRPDGEWAWIEARGRNLLDERSVRGVVVYARDVTERAAARRELAEYETLVDTVGDPMYVLDADGYMRTANEAMAEHLGEPREALLGSHASEYVPDADVERGTELIRELRRDDDRRWGSFEMRSEPVDGDPVYNETKVALLEEHDEFVGTVGVVRDITERERKATELERQNERLEDFASIVSHDLRNPLSVADGHLELLAELLADGDGGSGGDERAPSDHVETIEWALDRMRTLVEDLLVLARQGEAVDDVEPVALDDAVAETWQHVETADAELAVETDAVVRADRSRLLQLLANLVRNAVEHGGTDVSVTVGGCYDAGFYVADDGPGIASGKRDAVFEAGYSTADEGTGLGLAIVTEVAQAHGWSVDLVESAAAGARFEVRDVDVVADAEREAAAVEQDE